MKALELTGKKVGRWTVVDKIFVKKGRTDWLCECECGEIKIVSGAALSRGSTQSCGCYRDEKLSESRKTHGLSKTKEYQAWNHMIQRCENQNDISYQFYGARGIEVCKRWRESFENFLEDVGFAPTPKHSIDRIDVNGNYEPNNVQWASSKAQQNNKTNNRIIDLNDGAGPMTFNQQAERLGIPRDRVKMRLLLGWKLYDAFYGEKRINQFC